MVQDHEATTGLRGGDGHRADQVEEVPVSLTRRSALKRIAQGSIAVAAPLCGLAGSGSAAAQPNQRVRQWAMIIDLRYCDGCQSQDSPPKCTTACIEGHLVPEPMQWIEVYEAELTAGGTQFIPAPCQQCENPPCVNVCPVAATYSTSDGVVQIDGDRCIGCRMCMAACPYDRRFFNWGDAPVPPEALLADYASHHQIGAPRGTVVKCDFCTDLARAGALPQCVQVCPNGAIYYGDLEEDVATNGREVVSFRRYAAENNAYRLKEDLGTQPRVQYIPGHGELVGREPHDEGLQPVEWPWVERARGAVRWDR